METIAENAQRKGDPERPLGKDIGTLRQVWAISSRRERRRFLLMQPLMVFTALLETAGLASIVPFLALLNDPGAVARHRILGIVYEGAGFTSMTSFFFAIGVGVFLVVTIGNAVSALTAWVLLRFVWDSNHSISVRLMESYLSRPYAFFLTHSSTELAKNILTEVGQVVSGTILALTQMFSKAFALMAIMAVLLALDPVMALGAGAGFGVLYGVVFALARKQLRSDGTLRKHANTARAKLATEALLGIKEIKLYGLEQEAVRGFSLPSRQFGIAQARAAVIAMLPRFALETIAFGGVLIIVLGFLWRKEPLSQVLPVLGLYAFAAYKMMPGLQAIFVGLSIVRFSQSSLDAIFRDIEADQRRSAADLEPPLKFATSFELRNVDFSYEGASRPAISNLSLTIKRGQWVAFVGTTGAGKSTIVDMITGLLLPTHGDIFVDKLALGPTRCASWQRLVAYVPQQIFLVDDTIERNICLGVDVDHVDSDRMKWAAGVAQIGEFIESELPHAYQTQIGDRGIRISGGQRQRIGIARALYRSPAFLVLDEATSALDSATEALFFRALREAVPNVTVVSIAHRLSTTRGFDCVFMIERGELVESGSYDELRNRSERFKIMAQETDSKEEIR